MSILLGLALAGVAFLSLELVVALFYKRLHLIVVFALSALTGVIVGVVFAVTNPHNTYFAIVWTAGFALILGTIVTLVTSAVKRSSSRSS